MSGTRVRRRILTPSVVGAVGLVVSVLGAAPAGAARGTYPYEIERSWAVPNAFAVDVAPNGSVVALAGTPTAAQEVRVYSSVGRPIATWPVPDATARGVAWEGTNVVLVSGGGTSKVRLSTFSRSGQAISAVDLEGQGDAAGRQPLAGSIAIAGSGDRFLAAGTGEKRSALWRVDTAGRPLADWGAAGVGPGQFKTGAGDVAVDGHGAVYATDTGADRVLQFTDAGKLVRAWGRTGKRNGQFRGPGAIDVGPDGNVWVADGTTDPRRIQRFTATGRFLETAEADGSNLGPDGGGGPGDTGPVVDFGLDRNSRLFALTGGAGKPGTVRVLSPARDVSRARLYSMRISSPGRRLSLRIKCGGSAECPGEVRISKGGRTIARGRYAIQISRIGTARVTPTRYGARTIAAHRSQRVRVTLTPDIGVPETFPAVVRR